VERLHGPCSAAGDLGAHDHLCFAFDRRDDFLRAASAFLAAGVEQGMRVMFVGSGDVALLAREIEQVPLVSDLRARTMLEVCSLDERYDTGRPVSASDTVAAYAALVERALGDGFTGLRVAADVTELVRTDAQRIAFAEYEARADRLAIEQPFSAMCAFDRESLGDAAVSSLACLHPVSSPGTTPFHLFACDTDDAQLDGEVDAAGAGLFQWALSRWASQQEAGVWSLDASALEFVDHRALVALDRVAQQRGARIVVRNGSNTAVHLAELLRLGHVTVEAA
jgi:anti-anti-sigma regulatory factor